MKKIKLAVSLLSLALLAGCGGGSNIISTTGDTTDKETQNVSGLAISITGPNTIEVGKSAKITITIENDTTREGFEATVSDQTVLSIAQEGDGITFTGLKEGTATLNITASADKSVTKAYEITVTKNTDPSISIKADSNQVTVGSNLTFSAETENVSGTISYSWTNDDKTVGTFMGNGKQSITYKANGAGTDVITLEVMVGSAVYRAKYNLLVLDDYTKYTAISTADEFKSKILSSDATNLSGKYYLTADIDLGDYSVSAVNSNDFKGILDGRGYSLSGFSIDAAPAAALFGTVSGTVRNLSISGEISKAGSGWGSALLGANVSGKVDNCYFYVDHTFDNGELADENGWLPFVAAIAGVIKESGIIHNVVVNVANTVGKSTVYADTAYPAGGAGTSAQSAQTFSISGLYTNTTVVGGQTWEWGGPVQDMSGYTVDIDFGSATADTYSTLNPALWNLADSTLPSLKKI